MRVVRRVSCRIFPLAFLSLASTLSLTLPAAAQITRVSVAADGTQANGHSGPAAISADRRYVVFASAATNLVASDANASIDVFLRDRQTGAIARLNLDDGGQERTGDSGVQGVAISADGNVVAFTSRASLLPGDADTCDEPAGAGTGPSCTDIYVWRRDGGSGTLSRPLSDLNPNGPSRQPKVDATGANLAFTSDATNLVTGDTNAVSDVFLTTLTSPATVRRVSVSSAGAQANGPSYDPAISQDAAVIAFVSDATTLSDVPDPAACPPTRTTCGRAFVHVWQTGTTTTRVPTTAATFGSVSTSPGEVLDVDISADGRYVVSGFVTPGIKLPIASSILFDRTTGRAMSAYSQPRAVADAMISGDGRYIGFSGGSDSSMGRATLIDRVSTIVEVFPTHPPIPTALTFIPLHGLSHDGRMALFTSPEASLVAGDTDLAQDVFVFDRDRDHDGAVDKWETTYGLNPDSAADGNLDPDEDGLSNVQEYQANGHPNGTFKRYFAEGALNLFFQTYFALLNRGGAPARVQMRYLGSDDGAQYSQVVGVPSLRKVDLFPPMLTPEKFATVIESDQPLAADRSMVWFSAGREGNHLETAMTAPSTVWYLAEGATHGAFDLFYLLQNGSDVATQATVEYIRPAPLPPVIKTYTLAAHSTKWAIADTRVGLPDQSSNYAQDLYVLIANTSDQAGSATVRLFFNPGGSDSVEQVVALPAQSRVNARILDLFPLEAVNHQSFGVIVESNGVPIVVERAVYMTAPGNEVWDGGASALPTKLQ